MRFCGIYYTFMYHNVRQIGKMQVLIESVSISMIIAKKPTKKRSYDNV